MIHSEKRGSVSVLRIEHGKANAIDTEFFENLDAALSEVEGEPGGIVLTGSGSIFSAGVDLVRVLEGGADYLDHFVPKLTVGLTRVFSLPKPVVAAVNGHAIAGGCILACACDYRVAAAGSARMGVPELRVGVPFPTAPLEILKFVVPNNYLQEVVYSGRAFPLEAARERGLVDEIVNAEELLDRACEVAERFAAIGPASFRMTKRQLRQPALDRIGAGIEETDPEIEEIWKDRATHKAIRRYVQETLGK